MIYYPPVGFYFKVTFGLVDLPDVECNFQEVNGLDASFEMETVKEGGQNQFVHRLPTNPTYGNLILKRGMLVNSTLINWFAEALQNFNFQPVQVTVNLLNKEQKPLAAWVFENAIPVKWSVSGFNAMENSLVAESIELSYNYMRRVPLEKPVIQSDAAHPKPDFDDGSRTMLA